MALESAFRHSSLIKPGSALRVIDRTAGRRVRDELVRRPNSDLHSFCYRNSVARAPAPAQLCVTALAMVREQVGGKSRG